MHSRLGSRKLVGTAVESRNRPSAVVSLHDYVRPASLRYEFGHEDTLSYRTIWFDYRALDREVITAARTKRAFLPKLWDETHRSIGSFDPYPPSMSARSS